MFNCNKIIRKKNELLDESASILKASSRRQRTELRLSSDTELLVLTHYWVHTFLSFLLLFVAEKFDVDSMPFLTGPTWITFRLSLAGIEGVVVTFLNRICATCVLAHRARWCARWGVQAFAACFFFRRARIYWGVVMPRPHILAAWILAHKTIFPAWFFVSSTTPQALATTCCRGFCARLHWLGRCLSSFAEFCTLYLLYESFVCFAILFHLFALW